jgi:hypothetical protein
LGEADCPVLLSQWQLADANQNLCWEAETQSRCAMFA